MGQQSLIYSFVARGTVILADYTDFSGNFAGIAAQCLQKLPATNNKFTYNCDGHTFNYLVDNGFTYCVVAAESVGRQIPIAYLERIKEDFTNRYGGGKAAIAVANSLKKEFGPKLKEQMQYCMDHPEEVSKLAKVKAQVSEVKGVMMENIDKVLDRGVKIELLVDKTENLHSQLPAKENETYSGTRFQAAGDPDKEENVVAEHENKADSVGDLDCPDFHHSIVNLRWLQMLKMIYLHSFGGYTYQLIVKKAKEN
uniref:Vesicle-associated membrane protein 72 n=1 Tax=Populus alba TaxID=43335 RepID=A0A4U5QMK4_POPAL|nr:vesicle-associated membrane protein 72 [Populus alba]